ncbi:MAG: hypothetical protein HY402_03985 [Elusimicrobia bacterium]|nr:hypothetical protein [Elusimicrobiota bacterium]
MKSLIRTAPVLIGVFVFLCCSQAYAQDEETVNSFAVSGNLFSFSKDGEKSALPGVGIRAGGVVGGPYDDVLFRAYLEGTGAWSKQEENSQRLYGVQARLGGGVFDFDNSAYYMVFTDLDFDGAKQERARDSSAVWVTGGEVGVHKTFGKNNNVIYIGGNTGLGIVKAHHDFVPKPGSEGVGPGEVSYNRISRAVPAVGTSLHGRFGDPNERGTVYVNGTASYLVGTGYRFNAGADVNISRHIQVGGGIRRVYLDFPGANNLGITHPFVRVSLHNSVE